MTQINPSAALAANGAQLDELLSIDASSISTVVDNGVHFEGKLTVTGGRNILISGKVTGAIESDGTVIVNAGAEVVGSLRAVNAQIAGTVQRRNKEDLVDVSSKLVLAKGARVVCDTRYGDLKAEHGVLISGAICPRDMDLGLTGGADQQAASGSSNVTAGGGGSTAPALTAQAAADDQQGLSGSSPVGTGANTDPAQQHGGRDVPHLRSVAGA